MSDQNSRSDNALGAKQLRAAERKESAILLALTMPAIIVVALVIIVPVGWLFSLSFLDGSGQLSLVNYQKMIEYKSYMRVFKTTFNVSFLTTFLCILIGYPLAYFLSQMPRKYVGLFMLTVLLPFWTSLLVRTYAWLVMLQRNGLINNFAIDLGIWDTPVKLAHNLNGTLIGMVHIMLPLSGVAIICCHAAHRSQYPASRGQFRRNTGANILAGICAIILAWCGGRIADCVCPMPWLLCDTSRAWRRQGDHGVNADYRHS